MRERFRRDVHCLLGLPFDAVDMDGAVRHVRDAATRRTPFFVSTPNLNFVVGSRTDRAFRESVICSDFSLADGMPLIWIARLLGVPIHNRIAGSSVFDQLKTGIPRRLRIYFFGGAAGVAAAAGARLNAEQSGLICAGFESPGFGSVEEMSSEASIARINASGADCLFVSLGAKKGQAWIERNRARISVPVISHLGAVMNFTAGTVNRAPAWMQSAGAEWLWRIKEEPALWRRYFYDGLALLQLLFTKVLPLAWHFRNYEPSAEEILTSTIERLDEKDEVVILLHGPWGRNNLEPLRDCFTTATRAGKHIRIEMTDVPYVDSSFLGLLLLVYGAQIATSDGLSIGSASTKVRRIFKYSCCDFLFQSKSREALDGNIPQKKIAKMLVSQVGA
jgi:N-acetylglucosaminyldiphosphoundecaprenol N-acetyl-beta-D-mannosaminyltransferase